VATTTRIAWLKDGDKNTRYFYRQAVWRARKNKIKKLKDSDGNWQEDQKVLKLTLVWSMRNC
jgi:hypothetical protein